MRRNNITILALCLSITSCSVVDNVTSINDSSTSGGSSAPAISEITFTSNNDSLNICYTGTNEIPWFRCTYTIPFYDTTSFEVTSSDGVNFYKPTLDKTGSKIESFTKTTEVNEDYYEQDIYFMTQCEGEIYLTNNSSVEMESGDKSTKSTYGDFSRDYMIGAIRLSFQVTGYQNSTSQVYNDASNNEEAPGKIIEPDNAKYSKDDGSLMYQVNKINLSNNAGLWSVNPYDTNKPSEKVYKIEDASKGTFSSELVETEGFSAEQKIVEISSSSLTHPYTENNYQITKVTLRIWVEGQDNEAKTPLINGNFDAYLQFDIR